MKVIQKSKVTRMTRREYLAALANGETLMVPNSSEFTRKPARYASKPDRITPVSSFTRRGRRQVLLGAGLPKERGKKLQTFWVRESLQVVDNKATAAAKLAGKGEKIYKTVTVDTTKFMKTMKHTVTQEYTISVIAEVNRLKAIALAALKAKRSAISAYKTMPSVANSKAEIEATKAYADACTELDTYQQWMN